MLLLSPRTSRTCSAFRTHAPQFSTSQAHFNDRPPLPRSNDRPAQTPTPLALKSSDGAPPQPRNSYYSPPRQSHDRFLTDIPTRSSNYPSHAPRVYNNRSTYQKPATDRPLRPAFAYKPPAPSVLANPNDKDSERHRGRGVSNESTSSADHYPRNQPSNFRPRTPVISYMPPPHFRSGSFNQEPNPNRPYKSSYSSYKPPTSSATDRSTKSDFRSDRRTGIDMPRDPSAYATRSNTLTTDRYSGQYSPRSFSRYEPPGGHRRPAPSHTSSFQPHSPLRLVKQPTSFPRPRDPSADNHVPSLPAVDGVNDTKESSIMYDKRSARINLHSKETFHHQQPRPGKSYNPGFATTKADSGIRIPRTSYKSEFLGKVSQFRLNNDSIDLDGTGMGSDFVDNSMDVDETVETTTGLYPSRKKKKTIRPLRPKEIVIPDAISVANLAQVLVLPVVLLQRQTKDLLGLKFDVTPGYILNSEMATLVAQEVAPSVKLKDASVTDTDLITSPARSPEEYSKLPIRAPVVTIMGHVDHGKTTLLDTLRKSAVAASEAGGITQHIGAFEVHLPQGDKITFLDTPGHSAFETMRARGANVTDIVVLVVAAEDGVMPQTIEAIKHAQAADVPIIVAVNKCDKPGIDKQKIKAQLLNYNVQVEDLGGDTICVEISGLTGKGLSDLDEAIVTLAEMQEIRADPTARAEGYTLESQVQKGRGATATTLIKDGTLRVGDIIVAGTTWCKVRALISDKGDNITEAGPSTPVEVLGWKEVPSAGERVVQVQCEEIAKRAVVARQKMLDRVRSVDTIDAINSARLQAAESAAAESGGKKKKSKHGRRAPPYHPVTTADKDGIKVTTVSVIIKGDVSGSVEAVADAVNKMSHPELRVSVISQGVGKVSESDVDRAFAATTESESIGIILGFNVQSEKQAAAWAKRHDVVIQTNKVIYKLMEQFKARLGDLLSPETVEENMGTATVAQIYKLNAKSGDIDRVAGCKVTRGTISKANIARIVREGECVWQGKIRMIRHFKVEVLEIGNGNECGLAFDGFGQFKEGDVVESIRCWERPRTLD